MRIEAADSGLPGRIATNSSSIKPSLTVVILTYNEARHIERSIASVASLASDILVVDSFSSDNTTALATNAGARVLSNKFINYSKQFQWALDNGDIQSEWIMRLDADEIIEDDLAKALEARLSALPADVVGLNFDRKHIFMGRWIRHGGRFPLELLRVWRNGQGRIEDRWMDEHIVVWGGKTLKIDGGFSDINLNDLTFFTDKHNKYATREAIDQLSQRYHLFGRDDAFSINAVSWQAGIKRWAKENVYNRLPFWVGPLGYFMYRYTFQLGFLDGKEGLIYHFLQGFWYRFLVGAKTLELEREILDCRNNDERIEKLRKVTGLSLDSLPR